ncbi:MAG: bestrophin family protein [Myxococcota bacterium]|nr:bestrophin family protein [Myxococcota bacterium]
MIVGQHTRRWGWVRMVLRWQGTTLPNTWGRILITTLFAVGVTIFWKEWELSQWSLSPLPFSLIGVALGIFLGFRNNTSYDRFWEGRKLWGRVVNLSRIWTRQTFTLLAAAPDSERLDQAELHALQREMVKRQIAYVHALRIHLRGGNDYAELDAFIDERERKRIQPESNTPAALLHHTGELLTEAWQRGWILQYHLPVMERTLSELTEVQGGCERIKATPIPFGYTVLMHRIVALYCITLPFGIEDTVGVLTPAVVALVSFAFYGLDSIGDEIEEPFGFDPNDLPLNALSKMIEINLTERLDDEPPEPHAPKGEILD